ncbi:hypothetical protein Y032_0023g705 [Ancylostoma ceylanicum]|uniref:Uncharacterized protein n=1 Tax=Ancylostoma ceylanicum TaxID=53326 RepID=A0A016UWF5_9BILA|nr:hypothetical protein Y032_0023g705 [Ancylostoma ceylanicum]
MIIDFSVTYTGWVGGGRVGAGFGGGCFTTLFDPGTIVITISVPSGSLAKISSKEYHGYWPTLTAPFNGISSTNVLHVLMDLNQTFERSAKHRACAEWDVIEAPIPLHVLRITHGAAHGGFLDP